MSIVQLSAIGIVKYTGNYGLSGPYVASGITPNYFDIAVDDTNNIIWQYQLNDTWEEYNSPETLLSLINSNGSGNVSGPGSSTDNAIVRFDSTTGKLIQNSTVTITDAGNIVLSGTVDGRDVSVDGTKLDTIETSADVTDTANVSAALSNTLSIVTPVTSDYILIQDASDSYALKKVLVSNISGGGGDVNGPTSSTDNAIVRFDSTTGRLVQNSTVTITDAGNIVLSGTVDGRDVSTDGTKLDTIEVSADITDTANVSAALNNALVAVTAVDTDYVLIQDASDSFKLKKSLKSDFGSGSGSGNVSGVSASIDNEIVLFDGTGGKTIKQSGMYIDSTSLTGTVLNFDSFNVTPATSSLMNGDLFIIDNGTNVSLNYYDSSTIRTIDVGGPTSSTDNAIVRFDSTTGKLIQNSTVTITDAGNIVLSGTVDGRDVSVDGTKLDTVEVSADVTDTANVSAALNNALVSVSVDNADYVLIQDASDSFKLKKSLKSDFGSFWWPVRVTADAEDCVVSGSVRFHLPVNMTINSWALGCSTAPVGSSLNVALKHYDTMLPGWSTLDNGSIADGAYVQNEVSVNDSLTVAITYGIWLEVIITAVGSTTPGKGLVAYLKLTPT